MYYKFRITRKTTSDNELEKNVVRKDMNVYDHERLQWRNLTRVCSSRESLSLSPPPSSTSAPTKTQHIAQLLPPKDGVGGCGV